MEVDVVTRTIVTSEMTERDDLAAAALRDPGRSGNRARRYSEEGRKDNILAAVILIGGIPDGPVFLKAAKQGNAVAQYNLGVMYQQGKGVPKNDKTAGKWYTLAAEQGDADAQSNLGWMYYNGRGVLQDYVRAHMWFNIAASLGDKDDVPKYRDEVEGDMTSAQIAKAQNLAIECVRKKYKGC